MRFKLLLIVFFGFAQGALAQQTYSGNVLDWSDKNYLEGVLVQVIGKDASDSTNVRGYFSVIAEKGDTLKLSYPGFFDQKLVLGEERYLQLQIQDQARLLPMFEVKSEPYSFRFQDGKLVVVDPEEEKPSGNSSGISTGYLDSPNATGGVAIAGVLSSLTKRARQERQYQKKLAWEAQREGYYAIVESDSVRRNLMVKHQLERKDWDYLIIRFNEGASSHEFLGWSSSRVYATLNEFIEREKRWIP